MLQDLRHLILLDFRSIEDFNKSHIRKSIKVDLSNYKKIIASLIVSLGQKKKDRKEVNDLTQEVKKAMENMSLEVNGHSFKTHYPNDDLKRVLMIFPESTSQNAEMIKQVTAEIQAISDEVLTVTKERISKVFYLTEFTEFALKYQLLCVPAPCTNEK